MSATPYARDAGRGKEEIERTIPLGRLASPEDCAGPIVFLRSDLAGHITGEILNVNGGSVLCGGSQRVFTGCSRGEEGHGLSPPAGACRRGPDDRPAAGRRGLPAVVRRGRG